MTTIHVHGRLKIETVPPIFSLLVIKYQNDNSMIQSSERWLFYYFDKTTYVFIDFHEYFSYSFTDMIKNRCGTPIFYIFASV